MKHQAFYIAKLFAKQLREGLTDEEQAQLDQWMDAHPENKRFAAELREKAERGIDLSIMNAFDEKAAQKRFEKHTDAPRWLWYGAIAASILLSLGLSWSILSKRFDQPKDTRYTKIEDTRHKNDVLPAEVGAYILRGDGSQLEVDSQIVVLQDGGIQSESGTLIASREQVDTVKNTLVVPAAHFFAMQLSDGTKVWVNANSQLRFPATFPEKERRVELNGEAYFEVAKQERPFLVVSEGLETQVLGTHFNVNAYDGTPSTTLLEGRVRVRNGLQHHELVPGQKAKVTKRGIQVRQAEVDKEIAWKNNTFQFKGDNIVEIARQLKNWYNLDVSLVSDVSLTKTYSGEISRDVKLSEVLRMLEYASQLDFRIEENKLLILNKKA